MQERHQAQRSEFGILLFIMSVPGRGQEADETGTERKHREGRQQRATTRKRGMDYLRGRVDPGREN